MPAAAWCKAFRQRAGRCWNRSWSLHGQHGTSCGSAVTGGLIQPPEVAQFGSICTTMIDWVSQGSLNPLLSLNQDLGPITALAFNSQTDSKANLAIADDPALVVPDQTLQKSHSCRLQPGCMDKGTFTSFRNFNL